MYHGKEEMDEEYDLEEILRELEDESLEENEEELDEYFSYATNHHPDKELKTNLKTD
jgi:hypothetical protein